MPNNIELDKIQAFRFVVKNDTIVFSVTKILGDIKTSPEKSTSEELNNLFKGLKKWELHIDNFKYCSEADLLLSAKKGEKRTSIYRDYKLYGLRTSNFKYYVVKA